VEFALVGYLAVYVAWSQLFAWSGSRFALAGEPGPLDPFLLRQAVDSMAARWVALIVGLSTLVPETPRRNAALVAIFAGTAMALTASIGLTDAAYRPHLGLMLALMGFWMSLAGTIGIFGSYKLAELRQRWTRRGTSGNTGSYGRSVRATWARCTWPSTYCCGSHARSS
jgi:hypothetical protein